MKKKILIAIDGSTHSRNAMNYGIMMAGLLNDITFELMHIQSSISGFLLEDAEKIPAARSELKFLNEKNKAASLNLLETSRNQMVKMGVAPDDIEIKTLPRQYGVADDIVRFAEAGLHDAILIGRRGVSALMRIFMGSVTANILAQSAQIPVWVVDGEVQSRDFLVAIDGSDQSLRVIKHLAFMLRGSSGANITIMSVKPMMSDYCDIDATAGQIEALERSIGDSYRKCIADFRPKAIHLLEEAGLRDDRFRFRTIEKALSPARAIIEETEKNGYGTIIIGKRGMGTDAYMGRITSAVIQKISNNALWIVP